MLQGQLSSQQEQAANPPSNLHDKLDLGSRSVGPDPEDSKQPVQLSREVETLLLDNIDAKLAELQDLDVETIVLERHLASHNGKGNELSGKVLEEVENKMISAYKDELDTLKRKIITSNHVMNSNDIKRVNKAVDNAGVFLEGGREMVETIMNNHLESEEHKHEHDHEEKDGHESHADDFVSDYSDLLTDQEEMTKDEEEAIMKAIQKDLLELDALKAGREELEKHLREHWQPETKLAGAPDDLAIAEEVLMKVNTEDIENYKKSLQNIKNEILVSNGHLNLKKVDQIIGTLERANIFLEVNKDRVEVVSLMDEEMESSDSVNDDEGTVIELEGDDEHFIRGSNAIHESVGVAEAESKLGIDPVNLYSEDIEEAVTRPAEGSHNILHNINISHIAFHELSMKVDQSVSIEVST